MDKKLKWKAEVTFEGTMEEFQSFQGDMEKHPIKVGLAVSEATIFPRHWAGYIPANIREFFPKADQFEKMTQGAPRMKFTSIKDIAGGIRTPHLHVGNEVILVDKERFKSILGEVSRNVLEHRIGTEEDYFNVIKPIAGV